jgi:hypothetical protein
MTNKPHIALGVVSALALAAGQANAAQCPTGTVTIAMVTAPSFNCTDDNLTFNDFTIGGWPATGFLGATATVLSFATPDSVVINNIATIPPRYPQGESSV